MIPWQGCRKVYRQHPNPRFISAGPECTARETHQTPRNTHREKCVQQTSPGGSHQVPLVPLVPLVSTPYTVPFPAHSRAQPAAIYAFKQCRGTAHDQKVQTRRWDSEAAVLITPPPPSTLTPYSDPRAGDLDVV